VKQLGTVLRSPLPDKQAKHGVSSFLGTVQKLEDGTYRLFYTVWAYKATGVARSRDGHSWELPDLGQRLIDGKDSNLLRVEGLPEGASTLAASVLPLGAGRWRMYFLTDAGGLGYRAAESDDGLHWKLIELPEPVFLHPSALGDLFDWKAGGVNWQRAGERGLSPQELAPRKRLLANDSPVVYRDPLSGRYELYTPSLLPNPPGSARHVSFDNAPGVLRAIQRRLSADGLRWADPELLLVPDGKDPMDLQFYQLAQFRHEGWRVGMLGHYRVPDQTTDLELTFSTDGRTWERPLRGGWVPRGGPGEPDHFAVYPPRDVVDLSDGKALLLYTGAPAKHNATPNVLRIMAGEFVKHRLVGIAAGSVPGLYQSRPFILTHAELTVDGDLRGPLRAEVCNAFGEPLAGFRFADCQPVHGDSKRHVLRWKGDTARLQYEAMVLRLEFRHGEVFGVAY
jgi:hypothetical protein